MSCSSPIRANQVSMVSMGRGKERKGGGGIWEGTGCRQIGLLRNTHYISFLHFLQGLACKRNYM